MALDWSIFQTLVPSRFITFTIPLLFSPSPNPGLLRVAVLDSPTQPTHTADATALAVMIVPDNREHDWIFSTEQGHRQLIHNFPDFPRLILIGNQPIDDHPAAIDYHRPVESDAFRRNLFKQRVMPLVLHLSPRGCSPNGELPEVSFLEYEDDVAAIAVIDACVGEFIGEMLVEDVEIHRDHGHGEEREFWRRLRFKRMPILVQTQVRLVPKEDCNRRCLPLRQMPFRRIDNRVLVHPYLAPMVASLSLISSRIDESFRNGLRPKVLCLGVGGGALLVFLRRQLDFEVLGVEVDEAVLSLARRYFGLEDDNDEALRLIVGDAIKSLEKLASQNTDGMSTTASGFDSSVFDCIQEEFDAIMVDIDSSDVGVGLVAPPSEFVKKHILSAARSLLCSSGVLVVNVIPRNRSLYATVVNEFREVFPDLYEVDVNGENFVLVAAPSVTTYGSPTAEASFTMKLRSVLPGNYIDSIRKI